MKERTLTGFAIIFVVAVVFLTKIIIETPLIFDAFVGLILVFGALELANILKKMDKFNHQYLIAVFPILVYALLMICISSQYSAVLSTLLVIGLFVVMFFVSYFITIFRFAHTENEMRVRKIRTSKSAFAFKKATYTSLGYIYPTLPVLLIVPINHLSELNYLFENALSFPTLTSIVLCALCFLIPVFCDTFAYLTGLFFGGKKIFPNISPKKTISGAIGGIVWTVLLIICLYLIFSSSGSLAQVFSSLGITWWHMAIVAFLGALACEVGDLVESYLKRRAGLKDSGNVLPGHGGILDRIDGFTLVIPVIFLCFFAIV